MLGFREFIAESLPRYPDCKAWMSPSGKPHLMGGKDEHKETHHPEYEGYPSVVSALRKGFTRFGYTASPEVAYLQYDGTKPEGRRAARYAIQYMKLSPTATIYVTNNIDTMSATNSQTFTGPKDVLKMLQEAK